MTAIATEKKNTVTVTFNGQDREVAYEPHADVAALLEHAKQAFGVQSNHLLNLFTEGGSELPEHGAADSVGVRPGEVLVLQQSTVRGG
jgi:hypothetical protein